MKKGNQELTSVIGWSSLVTLLLLCAALVAEAPGRVLFVLLVVTLALFGTFFCRGCAEADGL